MFKFLLLFVVVLLALKPSSSQIQQLKEINLGFEGENPANFSVKTHKKSVVCGMNPWSFWRDVNVSKFTLDDINAELCTHILYNGPTIDKELYDINPSDVYLEVSGHEWFKKVTQLKEKHKHLKVILSVGGWNSGVETFQAIASDATKRKSFIDSAIKMLQQYNFDGLNIVWMWPAFAGRGGMPSDKTDLTVLLHHLKEAFKAPKLHLGIFVNGEVGITKAGYELEKISKSVDHLYVHAMDYAGNWNDKTGHHALLKNPSDTSQETVSKIVNFLIEQKVPSEKIILTIPTVGRSFKLKRNVDGHGFGSATDKNVGFPTAFYESTLEVPYNEICFEWKLDGNWSFYRDMLTRGVFMKNGDKWISFDDPQSVREKVEFGLSMKIGGFLEWTIDTDDFNGEFCDHKKTTYPLLRTINKVLTERSKSPRRELQLRVVDDDEIEERGRKEDTTDLSTTTEHHSASASFLQSTNIIIATLLMTFFAVAF